MNGTDEEQEWDQEKFETIMLKGIQIGDNLMALSDKNIIFKEETHFSELFMSLQQLIKTSQNFATSTSHSIGVENFLKNTLEHYLDTFNVSLDNPGQAIQLIR